MDMEENSTTVPLRSATLLIHCPDRKGLVAAVVDFILRNSGNIIHLDQHVDSERLVFSMRVEWDLADFTIPPEKIGEYFQTLVAEKTGMKWSLHFSDETPRMAVFVSRLAHCLYDILSRYRSGEWNVEAPLIISNHPDLQPVAEHFDIPFHMLPITPDNRADQEAKQLKLLRDNDIDFIVLARYMQVLSEEFISNYPNRIINIHHSFLPAFPGSRPYHSAHERGVKIIGATSHYVTAELDAGPIIEQDVTRISHRDSIRELIRKGQDLEKVVLSRAVWYHLKRKCLVYDNRTIVFD
jgi:formyltetrahydrofolate deformylase